MKGKVTQISINPKQVQYNIDLENESRMVLMDKDTDNLKYKVDQELTVTIT